MKKNPFLLASFAVPETVVSLGCSGFGQTLELVNEHLVLVLTPRLLEAGHYDNRFRNTVRFHNGIPAFGISVNGILNEARILHCIACSFK